MSQILKSVFFILISISQPGLFGFYNQEARIIDFRQNGTWYIPHSGHTNNELAQNPHLSFADCPEFNSYIQYLKNTFHLTAAIEIGAGEGYTSEFLSLIFDKLYVIENDMIKFNTLQQRLQNKNNISIHFDSSLHILKNLLPQLQQERVFIILNAFSNKQTHLIEELKIIAHTHKNNCILLINGVKLPNGDNPPFLPYQANTHFFGNLQKIFNSHIDYYLIPKDPSKSVKLVLIPKSSQFSSGWSN